MGMVAANDFNFAVKNKSYVFQWDSIVIVSHVILQQFEFLLLSETP